MRDIVTERREAMPFGQEPLPFSRFFSHAQSRGGELPAVPWRIEGYMDYRPFNCPIGPFCSIQKPDRGYDSMHVTPSDEVVEYVKGNMIAAGPNDTISFDLVYQSDGTYLVIARNTQIIGSRWLGYADASTVPAMPTRADYMEKRVTHQEYYGAIAEEAGISYENSDMLPRIRKALADGDEHLNTIPLITWDQRAAVTKHLVAPVVMRHGNPGYSLSDGVCVHKAAAVAAANS